MHNLASNNKHSHGVEGSLLQCFAGQFSQSQLSAVNLRLRGLLLCTGTMNNHTSNAMRVCDSRTYKALYLGAKDTTQSLWKTLVDLLRKHCCHKKCCGRVGCAAV